MSTALRDASVSMQGFLSGRLDADSDVQAMLPPGSSLTVSLNTPEEMREGGDRGLSLWLYRIVRDPHALNAPPRRVAPDRLRPAPLPVRLHYLVTPVFEGLQGLAAPEFEHALLGKVLQIFHEEPVLRGSDLQGGLANRDLALAVSLDTLSVDETTRIWDALEGGYRLGLSYEVGVVPIDGRVDVVTGPPVTVLAPVAGAAREENP